MSKSEVLELSKSKSKEIFKEYVKDVEGLESGDFEINDEDIEVIGLKEYETYFRIMIIYTKIKHAYLELIYKKKSGRLTFYIYEKTSFR